MTTVAAAGRRVLPRGWGDFAFQISLWAGFLLAYQLARGLADRNPGKAFTNGLNIIDFETRTNALIEISLQSFVHSSNFLIAATSYTYWLSQFTVLALALLWVYLRRNEAFLRFRNLLMLANLLGLAGYVLLPTAPPRMFPGVGFLDTLEVFGGLNHRSGLVEFASNPYAAMPSLHAADALIVGVTLAFVCRSWLARAVWLAWPVWVWFSVMATGNHFWVDVVAGVLVAALAALVLFRKQVVAALRR
ncbi:MAG: phosphatase PAP2 family protein [Actinomycetota bacterium]|nr:phosphatase PAP2 family protein [Actinomycetota bacterium]